ncbi:hypothetical protein K1W54_11940 [Micromonospora sp. CPCC 205371]|nr:hypothetical protein [Micromonospora sp. CPCC 205371]
MFDRTAMIMADQATKRHVLSARPHARTAPERPPRLRGDATRRLVVAALRRLADRLEPGRVTTSATAS